MLMLILLALILFACFLLLILRGRIITHPIKLKHLIKGSEKWTVSISKYGNEECVMNEVYLYTLNFIYGDREQQQRLDLNSAFTSQYIGNDSECKIQLIGAGVASKHGKIRFEQDWGLIYEDLTVKKTRSSSQPATGINVACLNAPYGYSGYLPLKSFKKITDGLKLYIGTFVLTFNRSIVDRTPAPTESFVEDYETPSTPISEDSLSILLGKWFISLCDKLALKCYGVYFACVSFFKNLGKKAIESLKNRLRKDR